MAGGDISPLASGARLIAAAPAQVLFEPFARPLLLAHAVVGFAALGSATHLAAYALLAARRGRGVAQLRRFSLLSPVALAAQALLGLALYPTYRVRVRLEDLERTAPAVVQLFDFKEHLAALAVALILAAAASARALCRPDGGPRPQSARWAVAALSASGAALTWIAALIGLYVTARHPVGTP
ncbi:MAG TPA: hypothetical protein VN874_02895 [Myxococcales bacterium]|nr:hypothetical protein [Myxococcales bacterium]